MYQHAYCLTIFSLLLAWSDGFHHQQRKTTTPCFASSSVLFRDQRQSFHSERKDSNVKPLIPFFLDRFDTISSAGLKNVQTAGGGGLPIYMFGVRTLIGQVKALPQTIEKIKNLPQTIQNLTWKDVKPIKRIKDLNGPLTYMFFSFLLARKYNNLIKNYFYWLFNAFLVKWYRARYVFKIPVWDRQPNWNNVITSKEQEKDLKAFTCKTCGSTIFIAKTREFFFEGHTGIGGLGCFSCGTKGKDNFVMDRDRICEDVADIDDYFEYERPLDFIDAAERRALLKEAGGDEDKANSILVERDGAQASDESQAKAEAVVNGATDAENDDDEPSVSESGEESEAVMEEDEDEKEKESELSMSDVDVAVEESEEEITSSAQATEESVASPSPPDTPATEPKKKKTKSAPSVSDGDSDEDLDLLDMDDL